MAVLKMHGFIMLAMFFRMLVAIKQVKLCATKLLCPRFAYALMAGALTNYVKMLSSSRSS